MTIITSIKNRKKQAEVYTQAGQFAYREIKEKNPILKHSQ